MTATTDAVTDLRTHWAARFTDAVAVTRMTDRGTFNETTLAYDTPTEAAVYTGAALIRPGDQIERVSYGEALATGIPILVYLPHDAATFQVEDSVEITACALDGSAIGKVPTIVGVDYDSYRTRTKLVCRLDLGSGYVD